MAENSKKPSKANRSQVISKLVKQFSEFRELDNPISKRTNKETWLKQEINGLKGCILVKTNDGNLLLNIKMKGQRYGLFFEITSDYEQFLDLINQKSKISVIIDSIMKVNGTQSANSDKVELSL